MSQKETPQREAEGDGFRVADPEEFNQTQRLKEIHEAKQNVAELVSDLEYTESSGHKIYTKEMSRVANVVAIYGMELLSLIRSAEVEFETSLPDQFPADDIFQFIHNMGMVNGNEPARVSESMFVYLRLNEFLAEVGLDLDVDQDKEGGYLDL